METALYYLPEEFQLPCQIPFPVSQDAGLPKTVEFTQKGQRVYDQKNQHTAERSGTCVFRKVSLKTADLAL